MKFSMKAAMAFGLALVMATGVQAGTVAFDISGGTRNITSEATLGYEFTVNSATTVTDLGYFDLNNDGLAGPHTVGIWDSLGTLLTSTTLAAGTGTLLDGFRYKTLSIALTLTAGTFRIGATNGSFGLDGGYAQSTSVTNNTSLVTHGTSYVTFGSGLNRPTTTFGDGGAYFGPNMIVAPAAVPVPAALPLLLAGLGGLAFMGRRKKRHSA